MCEIRGEDEIRLMRNNNFCFPCISLPSVAVFQLLNSLTAKLDALRNGDRFTCRKASAKALETIAIVNSMPTLHERELRASAKKSRHVAVVGEARSSIRPSKPSTFLLNPLLSNDVSDQMTSRSTDP